MRSKDDKIEKNKMHAAVACMHGSPALASSFMLKSHWSSKKSAPTKNITAHFNFHSTYLRAQIIGQSSQASLAAPEKNNVEGEQGYLLGKTLVIPPSVATNLATVPFLRGWKNTVKRQSGSH